MLDEFQTFCRLDNGDVETFEVEHTALDLAIDSHHVTSPQWVAAAIALPDFDFHVI